MLMAYAPKNQRCYAWPQYSVFQKHTKHTLFCAFVGLDCRLKHCVLTLVNEQSRCS